MGEERFRSVVNLVGLYVPNDETITPADKLIGYARLYSTAADASKVFSVTATVPGSYVGSKYVGAYVDFFYYVKDEGDGANNGSSGQAITINP